MTPRSDLPKIVRLKTDRVGHGPWVFRKMVERPAGVEDGEAVEVRDSRGRYVAAGFYNGKSQIALRILHRGAKRPLDDEFFRAKLRDAVYLRRKVLDLDAVSNAWRVVHAEGDGLSGLVVDRYAETLVVEVGSLGFWRILPRIESLLARLFPGASIVVRADARTQRLEGFEGPPPQGPRFVEIEEREIRFRVDVGSGHKTGFFLDQRDNRERFARYCRDRTVLDGGCYTGAFSLYARLRGGAGRVVGVDLDEKAVALARENAARNGADRVEFVHADLFNFLRARAGSKETFDAVVLDPPKLAATPEDLPRAEAFLSDLNALAMSVLKRNGLLLTCCCTGLVSAEDFFRVVRRAAARAEKEILFLEVAGQPPDHPVPPAFPEARYLTALFAAVREPVR